jgi:hypothetical protein
VSRCRHLIQIIPPNYSVYLFLFVVMQVIDLLLPWNSGWRELGANFSQHVILANRGALNEGPCTSRLDRAMWSVRSASTSHAHRTKTTSTAPFQFIGIFCLTTTLRHMVPTRCHQHAKLTSILCTSLHQILVSYHSSTDALEEVDPAN